MLRTAFFAAVGLALVGLAEAQAHFIWLDLQPSGAGEQARLYFSEEPEPGESHLIGKAAAAKTWLRRPDGSTQEIKLAAAGEADSALVADCPMPQPASLEGTWDYGVFQRGSAGLLLQYYAKGLPNDWTSHPELARSKALELDVVPSLAGGKLAVEVLYDGQPAADSEVVFIDPAGEHCEVKTDTQGRAQIDAAAGHWAVRAAYIEPNRSGERDGKQYAQAWHYSTVMLNVPSDTAAPAKEPSAHDTLVRARDGRAIWHDFPGFTSDLVVHAGGEEIKGKVTIDADGIVALDMPKSAATNWVEEQLNSLVQHRMPDGEVTQGDVKFAEADTHHPLGRKIDLGDPSLQSAYRIKDDVIMEVNRSMGPLRFTISVLEIERNPEHKYLPRSFTMNFFDSKTDELRSSLGYWNSWQRVGGFDLPEKIIEVDAHKGGANTKEIVFNNCQLLPAR